MHCSVTRTPYRVVFRGRLGAHVIAAFEGLELETRPGETVVTGAFDQARLHGLLDHLRDLGIELISINPVDSAGFNTNALEGP